MKIISWNINGIRAALKKGFDQWLSSNPGDIVGVQEVRALPEQIPEPHRQPIGWKTHYVAAERKGYSGVGLFSKQAPDQVETTLGQAEMDAEGRVQIATFGKLTLANVYFPNGSGKNRDNSRIPFKLDFYRHLFDLLEERRSNGGRVMVMGDFNTAHTEIDLARPKDNKGTSGFCPEEREELDRWIRSGWVDTFRHFNGEPGHYTWWSQRRGVRERNIGWRIDYVLASQGAMEFVKGAAIHPEVMGSDHCPISVDVKKTVFR
jgi:exodeoxyribonuclease-3